MIDKIISIKFGQKIQSKLHDILFIIVIFIEYERSQIHMMLNYMVGGGIQNTRIRTRDLLILNQEFYQWPTRCFGMHYIIIKNFNNKKYTCMLIFY